MDTFIKALAAAIVASILVVGVVSYTQEKTLGAMSSPDVQSYLNVHGVFTQGGGVFATTSIGASTLLASSVATKNVIERSGTGALTMTLPASTSVTGINDAGQTRTLYVFNAGTGALTLAGGSGTLLESASTTAIGVNGFGRIDLVRKANTDIEALFTHGI